MSKEVIARLDALGAQQLELLQKFDALLQALGAQVVEEPAGDELAAGFQAFAEASRKRHAKGRG